MVYYEYLSVGLPCQNEAGGPLWRAWATNGQDFLQKTFSIQFDFLSVVSVCGPCSKFVLVRPKYENDGFTSAPKEPL